MNATVVRAPLAEEAAKECLHRRFRALREAGFDAADAALIASDRAIELRKALDLVARGCPPSVALRILR